jgi:capsular exopolysaccharide synthesis family protein
VDSRIVTYSDQASCVSEEYKMLRNNIYALASTSEKPIKSIMITSSVPKEGKGITAANLAFALSLDKEKKVLLADADLRKPQIHNLFGIPRSPGLTDLLHGNITLDSVLNNPSLGNLYILPAGNKVPDPNSVISLTKTKEIIRLLKNKFDYIIFDTPPVISVSDCLTLGPSCDAALLVIKLYSTPSKLVEEASDLLKSSQVNLIGCVLTHAQTPQYYYGYKKTYYETG